MAMDQPYHTSDYYARYLLSPKAWTPVEKLAELDGKPVLLGNIVGVTSDRAGNLALRSEDVEFTCENSSPGHTFKRLYMETS